MPWMREQGIVSLVTRVFWFGVRLKPGNDVTESHGPSSIFYGSFPAFPSITFFPRHTSSLSVSFHFSHHHT